MKFIKAVEIKAGMKVAKAVQRKNQDVPIVKEGVILTEGMIAQIQKYDIYGIYIEENHYEIFMNNSLLEDLAKKFPIEDLHQMTTEERMQVAEEIVAAVAMETPVSLLLQRQYHFSEDLFYHCKRVAMLSVSLAMQLQYSMVELGQLALAALLHDIGKIKMDKSLIEKTKNLTENERQQLRLHVFYADQFLKKTTFLSDQVKIAILQHHENVNGTGYPGKTKGGAIIELAKIIRVTDAYDAIMEGQYYKNCYTQEEVFAYLNLQAGKLFDTKLVQLFTQKVLSEPTESGGDTCRRVG